MSYPTRFRYQKSFYEMVGGFQDVPLVVFDAE